MEGIMKELRIYTKDGCTPCSTLKERLNKLGIEYKEIKNCNDITSFPTMLMLSSGNEVARFVGVSDMRVEYIRDWMNGK
jgi:glutaredoxin-related protein